jgi:23S rRNA (uracil1939-C5)-methyltransferase
MRRRVRKGGGRQVELDIESLGGRGDGVATLEGRPVFLPFALPGERVRARLTGERAGGLKGEVIELLQESPGRAEPPCPHFGPCGGCALQHLAEAEYLSWKVGLLPRALARRGIEGVEIKPLIRVPPGSRRRVTLAAARSGGVLRLGFHGRESHAVVDLETCLLMTSALQALLAPLRGTLAAVVGEGESAALTVTQTETGLDLLIVARGELGLEARQALAQLAETRDLARVSHAEPSNGGAASEPEPVIIRRAPRVRFGGAAVEPPPGIFLQPTAEGEALLRDMLLGYLPEDAREAADLYAGCGAFTFPMSARARVRAVDGDGAALAALQAAARGAGLGERIKAETRDLARAPLGAEELNGFDCLVFDPPRAGAKEQAAEIARSAVPAVIAVSCNPGTFARDARLLIDGGYALVEATPLDQFPWSGHLELAALFRR